MPLSLILLIAVVQGVTEFLPVSSSGHLALIPVIIQQPYQGQTIDVAAHVGTLIAVLFYMRHELLKIIASMFGPSRTKQMKTYRRLGIMIIVATIPLVVIGFIVDYTEWRALRLITTLAWANLIFAGLLWATDRFSSSVYNLTDMRWSAAIGIGLMQIFALIPGASRSGVTMSAARFFGYDRITAARFSLLLSLPAISGAGFLKVIHVVKVGDVQLGIDILLVTIMSALAALLAIHLLMSWLTRSNFNIFVVYRLALGCILLLAIHQGWITQTL